LIALSSGQYGAYVGSTVHEVAQVVAAERAVSDHAADIAVIAKMVRVMMLAPFLVMLSIYLARNTGGNQSANSGQGNSFGMGRVTIPWFALGFVAVAGLNSLALLPKAVVAAAIDVDTAILAMAMAALGLTTHISAIRRAGLKPLALAALLFAWLLLGGAGINMLIGNWLG
jgi:uncharacterized integral membrane protein (TIGR00698 family)